jgi:hypothetical protein
MDLGYTHDSRARHPASATLETYVAIGFAADDVIRRTQCFEQFRDGHLGARSGKAGLQEPSVSRSLVLPVLRGLALR